MTTDADHMRMLYGPYETPPSVLMINPNPIIGRGLFVASNFRQVERETDRHAECENLLPHFTNSTSFISLVTRTASDRWADRDSVS
jgi:hypothetical protein